MMRVLSTLALLFAVASSQAQPGSRVVSTNYDPAPGVPAQTGAVSGPPPPASGTHGTVAPVIVSSLAAARSAGSAKTPKNWPPLNYPNNDEHQWVSNLHALQKYVNTHEEGLKDLNKQLEDMKEQRHKLLHAQKLLHSMVALHQSEQVLGKLDENIKKVKSKIKQLGETAEDLMSGREDTKKEMEEQMKELEDKLNEMRKKLKHHEATLTALSAKREDVANTVSSWREFVDQLRTKAGMPAKDSLTVPVLPRPPSSSAEEQEEAAEQEEGPRGASGVVDSSGDKDQEPRAAPMEEVKGNEVPGEVDTSEITAKPHEIKATSDSIDELLAVHLPRITGLKNTASPSFLEKSQQTRRLRRRRSA